MNFLGFHDAEGLSPLGLAVLEGRTESVAFLLDWQRDLSVSQLAIWDEAAGLRGRSCGRSPETPEVLPGTPTPCEEGASALVPLYQRLFWDAPDPHDIVDRFLGVGRAVPGGVLQRRPFLRANADKSSLWHLAAKYGRSSSTVACLKLVLERSTSHEFRRVAGLPDAEGRTPLWFLAARDDGAMIDGAVSSWINERASRFPREANGGRGGANFAGGPTLAALAGRAGGLVSLGGGTSPEDKNFPFKFAELLLEDVVLRAGEDTIRQNIDNHDSVVGSGSPAEHRQP